MAETTPTVYASPHLAIDGEVSDLLHTLLESLDIQFDESGLATLEAKFHNWGSAPPKTNGFQLFDGSLGLGRALTVAFSEDDTGEEAAVVFTGVITAIEGVYRELCAPKLRVRAEDALWALRLTRHTRVYEEASDADIVSQIARSNGLPVKSEAKGPTHTELLCVNQSDLALMRERARAVDASIGLSDKELQLAARAPAADPAIPISRLVPGTSLEISADLAHQRTEVQVHGWSVTDKEGIHASAGQAALDSEKGEGTTGADVLERLRVPAAEHHALEFPVTFAEAEGLAEALMRQRARRFVVARGSVRGSPRMKVGSELAIVDVGSWYTGRYKVVTLRHSYSSSSGFQTHFTATSATLGGGL